MNSTATGAYRARFARVLDYIDAHLGEELSVEQLSAVAAFSPYHFHRQFAALHGIGVFRYVQLTRLRRASHQLAFRDAAVGDIALAAGYENPESFSRAFRKATGQSPTEFRAAPSWETWRETYARLNTIRRESMRTEWNEQSVSIIEFPETRVASLMHRGEAARIGETVRQFIQWRRENQLPPRASATFNIVYERPADVPEPEFRMEICAATDKPIADNAYGVVPRVIPAGRCAMVRHIGSDDHLEDVATWLYSEWLPQSGEEPRDFPLFFRRVAFFPDVPEHEAVTEVYLPLR